MSSLFNCYLLLLPETLPTYSGIHHCACVAAYLQAHITLHRFTICTTSHILPPSLPWLLLLQRFLTATTDESSVFCDNLRHLISDQLLTTPLIMLLATLELLFLPTCIYEGMEAQYGSCIVDHTPKIRKHCWHYLLPPALRPFVIMSTALQPFIFSFRCKI